VIALRNALSGWSGTQRALLAAALLVWTAAIVLGPIMREAEIRSLAIQVADLRSKSRDAAALQARLRILRQPDSAAAARLKRVDALDTLLFLGKVLPDDMQLGALEITDASIGFSVVGGDARKAAAALERSGRFRRVALRAPVGRGAFRIELSR
jgi:hypothetical protein